MKNRHFAFTLIELLVVIAILGLLMSILLPSLSNARRTAKRAVCASNLKQVGIGLEMYVSENRQYFPPRLTGSNFEYVGKNGDNSYYAEENRNIKMRYLNPYVGGPFEENDEVEVAHCPADEGLLTHTYKQAGSSYPANNADGFYARPGLGTLNWRYWDGGSNSRMMVESPSKMLALYDSGFRSYTGGNGNNFKSEFYWHSKIGVPYWNALYTDGHVSFTRAQRGSRDTDTYTFYIDK